MDKRTINIFISSPGDVLYNCWKRNLKLLSKKDVSLQKNNQTKTKYKYSLWKILKSRNQN